MLRTIDAAAVAAAGRVLALARSVGVGHAAAMRESVAASLASLALCVACAAALGEHWIALGFLGAAAFLMPHDLRRIRSHSEAARSWSPAREREYAAAAEAALRTRMPMRVSFDLGLVAAAVLWAIGAAEGVDLPATLAMLAFALRSNLECVPPGGGDRVPRGRTVGFGT